MVLVLRGGSGLFYSMPASFIQFDGQSVHFQVIGELDGSKTVVVLLHEALGSIGQWKNFPNELHTTLGLPVIIPERTGHGQSSPLTNKRNSRYLHNYAVETQRFLQQIVLPGQQVVLVGHSDGGTIALLLAKHFPQQLKAVITMAAHTFVEAETLAGIAPAVDAWNAGKLKGLEKYHGDKTEALFFAWADTWRADFFRNWDIRTEITGIEIPVLAMQGEKDQYGTENQLKSIYKAVPRCEVQLIPDCGHHPHIEKPAVAIEAIEEWLKRIEKAK